MCSICFFREQPKAVEENKKAATVERKHCSSLGEEMATLVELEKCCTMNIHSQRSASILRYSFAFLVEARAHAVRADAAA